MTSLNSQQTTLKTLPKPSKILWINAGPFVLLSSFILAIYICALFFQRSRLSQMEVLQLLAFVFGLAVGFVAVFQHVNRLRRLFVGNPIVVPGVVTFRGSRMFGLSYSFQLNEKQHVAECSRLTMFRRNKGSPITVAVDPVDPQNSDILEKYL